MGIREKMNDNPAITTGVTAAIIVIALVLIVMQFVGSDAPKIPKSAWFSADNGATYVADDINLIPPFQKDGKTYVRAVVFKCGGGAPFVSHLERYTDKAKAQIEKARQETGAGKPPPMALQEAQYTGLEVKKTGAPDSAWVSAREYQKMAEVTNIKCPDGTTNDLEAVLP